MQSIQAQALSAAAFAPFGDMIEAIGASTAANQDRAQRFDAPLDVTALRAFIGQPTQGIVWRAGVWHSPFAALGADGDFLMQQWQCGGPQDCEEVALAAPVMIQA